MCNPVAGGAFLGPTGPAARDRAPEIPRKRLRFRPSEPTLVGPDYDGTRCSGLGARLGSLGGVTDRSPGGMDSYELHQQNPDDCETRRKPRCQGPVEVVIRKTPVHAKSRGGRIIKARAEQIRCTAQIKYPGLARDPENQTAARLWFSLQTLQTSPRQKFFRPAHIFDVAPLSFLAHAVLHAHSVVSSHICAPTSPIPFGTH